MKTSNFKSVEVFNQPLEAGIRLLYILEAFAPKRLDLQSLVYFDYFLLHSADLESGPPSIHPAIPQRSGKLLVRRELLREGLELLLSKELLLKHFDEEGIRYSANELSQPFLSYLSSSYSEKIRVVSKWLQREFGAMQKEEIESFVNSNFTKWSSEFSFSSELGDTP